MNVRIRVSSLGAGVLALALAAFACSPAEARTYRSLFPFFDPPRRAAPRTARKPHGTRQTAPISAPAAARNAAATPRGIPLPPRRPVGFAAPAPPPAPPAAAASGPAPAPVPPPPAAAQSAAPPVPAPTSTPGDDPETCTAVMASGKVVAEEVPAIHSGACGIAHPLMLKAIVLAEKRQIKLEPPVAMRCRVAGALADWIIEDVAPLVAAAGQPLVALSGVGAYECRGRNRVAGAKLSEHASGNAVDIGGLKLVDGRVITVAQQPGTQPILEKVRATACARFATVLGPGADAFHGTHVHLDLEERRHSNKLCQWNFPPASSAASTPPASSPPQRVPDPAEKKK